MPLDTDERSTPAVSVTEDETMTPAFARVTPFVLLRVRFLSVSAAGISKPVVLGAPSCRRETESPSAPVVMDGYVEYEPPERVSPAAPIAVMPMWVVSTSETI